MPGAIVRSLGIFVSAVLLSACGYGAAQAPPMAGAAGSGPLPEIDIRAEPDLASVLESFGRLAGVRGRLLAECLHDGGFPEGRRALHLTRPGDPHQRSGPLRIAPLDLGPSTPDEAQRLGLVGSSIPVDSFATGYVVSRSREFDRASEQCQSAIDAGVPDLGPMQRVGARLGDRVRLEFVTGLTAPLQGLLRARYECVRDRAFPSLQVDAAVRADDWEGVLALVGIEPGEGVGAGSESAGSVAPGEVAAFAPGPLQEYQPSAGEVAFSLAYVECGEVLDFQEQVDRLASTAGARLARERAQQAARLALRLHRLSDQVVGFESREK